MENNPQFITEFIKIYKKCPCLWRVKDKYYNNKRYKDKAYAKLAEHYRTVNPNATIDNVKKKINNLKCSFRKELKKVIHSKSELGSDEVYTPSLWYFDLLLFTIDQETSRCSVSSDSAFENAKNDEFQDEIESSTDLETIMLPSQNTSSYSNTLPSLKARKRSMNNEILKNLTKDDDEYDAVGVNVACKLRRMEEEQRVYAELLISKILINGLKYRLQEETNIANLKSYSTDVKNDCSY